MELAFKLDELAQNISLLSLVTALKCKKLKYRKTLRMKETIGKILN